MAEYESKYTWTIEIQGHAAIQQAARVRSALEKALGAITVESSKRVLEDYQRLEAQVVLTGRAVTSLTRRFSYHMRRIDEVRGKVQALTRDFALMHTQIHVLSDTLFDNLVQRAQEASDKLVGHSIIPEMRRKVEEEYAKMEAAEQRWAEASEKNLASVRERGRESTAAWIAWAKAYGEMIREVAVPPPAKGQFIEVLIDLNKVTEETELRLQRVIRFTKEFLEVTALGRSVQGYLQGVSFEAGKVIKGEPVEFDPQTGEPIFLGYIHGQYMSQLRRAYINIIDKAGEIHDEEEILRTVIHEITHSFEARLREVLPKQLEAIQRLFPKGYRGEGPAQAIEVLGVPQLGLPSRLTAGAWAIQASPAMAPGGPDEKPLIISRQFLAEEFVPLIAEAAESLLQHAATEEAAAEEVARSLYKLEAQVEQTTRALVPMIKMYRGITLGAGQAPSLESPGRWWSARGVAEAISYAIMSAGAGPMFGDYGDLLGADEGWDPVKGGRPAVLTAYIDKYIAGMFPDWDIFESHRDMWERGAKEFVLALTDVGMQYLRGVRELTYQEMRRLLLEAGGEFLGIGRKELVDWKGGVWETARSAMIREEWAKPEAVIALPETTQTLRDLQQQAEQTTRALVPMIELFRGIRLPAGAQAQLTDANVWWTASLEAAARYAGADAPFNVEIDFELPPDEVAQVLRTYISKYAIGAYTEGGPSTYQVWEQEQLEQVQETYAFTRQQQQILIGKIDLLSQSFVASRLEELQRRRLNLGYPLAAIGSQSYQQITDGLFRLRDAGEELTNVYKRQAIQAEQTTRALVPMVQVFRGIGLAAGEQARLQPPGEYWTPSLKFAASFPREGLPLTGYRPQLAGYRQPGQDFSAVLTGMIPSFLPKHYIDPELLDELSDYGEELGTKAAEEILQGLSEGAYLYFKGATQAFITGVRQVTETELRAGLRARGETWFDPYSYGRYGFGVRRQLGGPGPPKAAIALGAGAGGGPLISPDWAAATESIISRLITTVMALGPPAEAVSAFLERLGQSIYQLAPPTAHIITEEQERTQVILQLTAATEQATAAEQQREEEYAFVPGVGWTSRTQFEEWRQQEMRQPGSTPLPAAQALSAAAGMPPPSGPPSDQYGDWISADYGGAFREAAAGAEEASDWTEEFAKQINIATMQYFGIRRVGYGLQAAGSAARRFGRELQAVFRDASDAYLEFNEVTTRASMAMDLEITLREQLDEAILENAKSLGFFKPGEIAEGLRLWAAGTGEVVYESEQLTRIIADTVNIQKLALINSSQLGSVMEHTGGVIKEFGMTVADTARVTAVLNFVAARTFAEVTDVGQAFVMVGPVAAELNVTFEEMAAMIALLSERNIKGTRVGRALRQMFNQMLDPTKEHNEAMNRALGLSGEVGDQWQDLVFPSGEFIGAAEYIDLIAAATERYTTHERASFLAILATTAELPTLITLVSQQVEARKEGVNIVRAYEKTMRGVIDAEVYAYKAWVEQTTGLPYSLESAHALMTGMWDEYEKSDAARSARMKVRWEAIMIDLGKSSTQIILPAMERMASLVEPIAGFVAGYPQIAAMALGLGGIAGTVGILLTVGGALAGMMANYLILSNALRETALTQGASTGVFRAAVIEFAASVRGMSFGEFQQSRLGRVTGGVLRWLPVITGVSIALALLVAHSQERKRLLDEERQTLLLNANTQKDYILTMQEFQQAQLGEVWAGRIVGAQELQTAEYEAAWATEEFARAVEELYGPLGEVIDRTDKWAVATVLLEAELTDIRALRAGMAGVPFIYPGFEGLPPGEDPTQEALERYWDMLREKEKLTKEYNESVREAEADHIDDMVDFQEDYLRQVAKAQEKHRRQEARYLEDYERSRQKIIDSAQEQAIEQEAQTQEKRLEKIEDFNRKVQERYEDHLKSLARMELDHEWAMEKFARTRDARGALEEMRSYSRKVREANEDYGDWLKRAQNQHKRELVELDEYIEEHREKRQDDLQDRLDELEENFRFSKDRRDEDWDLQMSEMAENHERQRQEREGAHTDRMEEMRYQHYERMIELDDEAGEEIAQLLGLIDDKESAIKKHHETLLEDMNQFLYGGGDYGVGWLKLQEFMWKTGETPFAPLTGDVARLLAMGIPEDFILKRIAEGYSFSKIEYLWRHLQPRQAGGYATYGLYELGERGKEFVLSAGTTAAFERYLGPLSQDRMLAGLASGPAGVGGALAVEVNQQNWTFEGTFTADDRVWFRNAAREAAMEGVLEVVNEVRP